MSERGIGRKYLSYIVFRADNPIAGIRKIGDNKERIRNRRRSKNSTVSIKLDLLSNCIFQYMIKFLTKKD
ncbi:hypothetical protein SUSAZ_00035 [Sulfolobus acidocaldarius SUSAZ]|nr:hypothetical protein SUSAZ_00035 [Sulfolobus acidocaldarius SUSAZ]